MPRDLLESSEPRDLLAEKVSSVPTAETFIDKARTPNVGDFLSPVNSGSNIMGDLNGGIDRAVGFGIGGPTLAASGQATKNAEDSLPLVMGTIGGIGGSMVGRPEAGLALGTTLGDLEKQSIKKLKGTGDDINVADALVLGGLAWGGSKVMNIAFQSAGMSMKLIPERARAKLFDKTLQAVNIGRQKLVQNFGRAVTRLSEEFPDKRINLRPVVEQLKQHFDGMDETLIPQLRTAVKNNKALRDVVDDPNKAVGLTLKNAQELKSAIESTTNAVTARAIKGKTTPNERVLFEILDSVDGAITEAFPQMSQVRYVYKKGMDAFRMARPLVEPGNPVESSILSSPQGLFGLGGSPLFKSTQGRLATKDIMSQTEAGAKLFQSLKLAHNLNRASDAVGRLAEITFGSILAGKAVSKVAETTGQ